MSLYLLKPRFQALLRLAVRTLHVAGVSANQVTLAACAVSVALGMGLYAAGAPRVRRVTACCSFRPGWRCAWPSMR